MGCEIGMSPCWYVPPSRAAGVASPPPWSTQIRISRGDGLAKDCSNRADTTPANSQLVSTPRGAGTGLPSPKKLHAKDGGKQPRPPPPRLDETIPTASSRMGAPWGVGSPAGPPARARIHPPKCKTWVPSPDGSGAARAGARGTAVHVASTREISKLSQPGPHEHSSIGRSGRCVLSVPA